jgi:hypothetical protein
MGKTVAITPVYFSFAWALLLSYQAFTETAVNTVLREVGIIWPEVGLFLSSKTEIIVFVIAYSWVFLLSSVIPSAILGKRSGTLLQFGVVLVLTSSSLFINDLVTSYTGFDLNNLLGLRKYLMNPLDAFTYLAFPYLVMSVMDIYQAAREMRGSSTQ